MTQYVITGRESDKQVAPYNLITNQMSVGQTISLTLSTQDETTLINAGMIIPAAWLQVVAAAGGPPVAFQIVAPSGGDDTANIKAAVAAVVTAGIANGSYTGEVWFDSTKGPFTLSGALTQGGTDRVNAQVPIPFVADTGQKFTLGLRGGCSDATGLWHWLQTTPQKGGACLVSTIAGTNDATFGEASVIGGLNYKQATTNEFSNMLVVVDGVTIVVPNDPHICGFDFRCIAEANIKNAGVLANATDSTFTNPTQAWQFGLAMPRVGNNANTVVENYSAEALNYGAMLDEHTHVTTIRCINCIAGVEFGSSSDTSGSFHDITIDHATIEACSVAVGAVNNVALKVSVRTLEVEQIGFAVVNDPNNVLVGEIHASWQGGNTFLATGGTDVRGATGVRVIDRSRPRGHAAAPTVPASTVALTNPFWRDAAVTVSGGTVTVITVDGTATGLAATGHTVIVPSGKTITLTYSVAPAWNWVLF